MSGTVVRIEYFDGAEIKAVEFTAAETGLVTTRRRCNYVLKRLQNRRPLLYLLSGEIREYSIEVITVRPETVVKLELLRAGRGVMNLYPDYKNEPAVQAPVFLQPGLVTQYSMGRLAAERVVVLTFYETVADGA